MVVACDGLSCASVNTPGTQPAAGGSVQTVVVRFFDFFFLIFGVTDFEHNRFFRKGRGSFLSLLLFRRVHRIV
jgi:hypothetical protein